MSVKRSTFQMHKLLGLSLGLALALAAVNVGAVSAASDNSRNNIGDQSVSGEIDFSSAGQVHTFRVTIPDGADGAARNGHLTVETQDGFCCPDYWGVRIIKQNGQVMAEAVGDGSGTGNSSPLPGDWSGAATIPALPKKGVTVEVYYDHGSNSFPAGMWVRITFTGANVEVTQVS